MEHKNWTYRDFPEFASVPEGAHVIETTGDELLPKYIRDVVYAAPDGIPLTLQILIPVSRCSTADRPDYTHLHYPCIAYVQGSAWMKQDVSQDLCFLSEIARMGYVVAVIQYRSSSEAVFPAQIEDARNAVRFLKLNAAAYGIDPERIFMAGSSSGGHTAVYSSFYNDDNEAVNLYPGTSASVRGVISLYGSSSFMFEDSNPSTPNYCLPDSPEGLVMGGINLRERPDLKEKLSVECNIFPETDIPPVLIFHGTKDRTVNTECSVRLYERLRSLNKAAWLYLVKGADHGGAEFWSPACIRVMDEFIRRYSDEQ